jgi:hypothetical protein
MSQITSSAPLSPQELEESFSLTVAVQEEVERINAYMLVRKPGTLHSQAWVSAHTYEVPIEADADPDLLFAIEAEFEKAGWIAAVRQVGGVLPVRKKLVLSKRT